MTAPTGWPGEPDHKRIYLEPEDGSDPDTGRMWCQHPAPGADDNRTWTEYVRADLVAAQVAAAWCDGRDAAAKWCDIAPHNVSSLTPPDATDALARMIAEAEARGMEQSRCHPDVLSAAQRDGWKAGMEEAAGIAESVEILAHESPRARTVAAIRAAAKEGEP